MQATEEVAALEVQTPLALPIQFDLSDESVRFNYEVFLKESDTKMRPSILDPIFVRLMASFRRSWGTTQIFNRHRSPVHH